MIEFYFLGTSGGCPTKDRNLSGLCIRKQTTKDWMLIDCGEGTQRQLLSSPYSLAHLKYILITHLHGDHIFGLPGLLSTRHLNGYHDPLVILGPEGLSDYIHHALHMSFSSLPSKSLQFLPLAPNQLLDFHDDFFITPSKLKHPVPCFGFLFKEKKVKLPKVDMKKAQSFGLTQGPMIKKLLLGESITTSCGVIDPSMILSAPNHPRLFYIAGDNSDPQLLKDLPHLDLLIHEATYLAKDKENSKGGVSHSSALDLAHLAAKIEVKNLIANHFSPRYVLHRSSRDQEAFLNEMKAYKGRVVLAEDHRMLILKENSELV